MLPEDPTAFLLFAAGVTAFCLISAIFEISVINTL